MVRMVRIWAEFSGSLLKQMNEVYDYIDCNQTHSTFEKLGRIEQKDYTEMAVREGLGISQTSCGRLIKQMIENGQLIQKGKGKNTQYSLYRKRC